jgi:hypothetical protein
VQLSRLKRFEVKTRIGRKKTGKRVKDLKYRRISGGSRGFGIPVSSFTL